MTRKAIVVGMAFVATVWLSYLSQGDQCENTETRSPTVVSVEPTSSELPSKAGIEGTVYEIKVGKRKVGTMLVSGDGALQEVFILSDDSASSISVKRDKHGRFLGAIVLHKGVPGGKPLSGQDIFDFDADGIPDKRVDWNTRHVYLRKDVEWSRRPIGDRGKKLGHSRDGAGGNGEVR